MYYRDTIDIVMFNLNIVMMIIVLSLGSVFHGIKPTVLNTLQCNILMLTLFML